MGYRIKEYCLSQGIDLRLYNAWRCMRDRCLRPYHKSYKNYGGRGIKIHSRWDKFENFQTDVRPHPGKGWTLDRPRNNEDYGPDNWQWATAKTQARNRRGTKLTARQAAEIRQCYISGINHVTPGNISQLEEEYHIHRNTIYDIVSNSTWL